MKGYCDNIERGPWRTRIFADLYTGHHLQLVLMTLPPGCDMATRCIG